jgi:hypothetical protein
VLRQCTASNWSKNGARPATAASRRESPCPANITWRQEVGGSSIEISKIAGHANVSMTGDYTIVQLQRQDELTRAIQGRMAAAQKKQEEAGKSIDNTAKG